MAKGPKKHHGSIRDLTAENKVSLRFPVVEYRPKPPEEERARAETRARW
jgi:hypothetical protein